MQVAKLEISFEWEWLLLSGDISKRQKRKKGKVMSREGRRRAWREFSYYPEQDEGAEGLYSGLEISEYSDYNSGNNSKYSDYNISGTNANSDYASPVTEEVLLSPLSQRSLEQCEELDLDSGGNWLPSSLNIQNLP